MKILAIGNSFSQDATTFLHQCAEAQGLDCTVVNLFVGGCSLEMHLRNWEGDLPAYQYQLNGTFTGRMVSIREALEEGGWDAVVTQQCSHDSGWAETYEPFLTILLSLWKPFAPNAKFYLHETWAYETTSTHNCFMRYNRNQQEMHSRLRKCYKAASEAHGLSLIPCGDVMQALRAHPTFNVPSGGMSINRDGFHASFGYGRYLLALTWLKTLFGVSVRENSFIPQSVESVTMENLALIRETVEKVVRMG